MSEITESPAKGVTGFICKEFPGKDQAARFFFRVYESEDKSVFTDYDLVHHDLEVTISDESASLFKGLPGEKNILEYSSKVLGKMPGKKG